MGPFTAVFGMGPGVTSPLHETFESGIRKTVEWYLANTNWVENVKSGAYQSWIEQNYEGRQ